MAEPQPDPGIVIVGAGQAGYQLANSLRDAGYQGALTLIGDEAELPYQRPPLSKAFLSGALGAEALTFQQQPHFDTRVIDLRTGLRVSRIDRAAQRVDLSDGDSLAYDRLVLATGAANRVLPGSEGIGGIHRIRTLADARAIREGLDACQNAVVIGGGFLGLEFAAVARARGANVSIIEAGDRLMCRAISAPMSQAFAAHHSALGSEVLLNARIRRLVAENGQIRAVELESGVTLPADLVVVGIGVMPHCDLAEAAGLACRNGILVDDRLTTSDPHIFALGDCAVFPSRFAPEAMRLESIQNAVDQARHLALILTGASAGYDAVPWFWSDQGGAKLQIAGLSQGTDRVILRGDATEGKFSALCYRGDQLIAVESLNRPADHMAARRLLSAGLSPTHDQAADLTFELKSLLTPAVPAQ